MTTGDDFWAAIEADIDDHVCRLMFADWLQERDDPRAEGYRAIGARRAFISQSVYDWRVTNDVRERDSCGLPPDWSSAMLDWLREAHGHQSAWHYLTRREVEDAAALAFARLPAARRAELLATAHPVPLLLGALNTPREYREMKNVVILMRGNNTDAIRADLFAARPELATAEVRVLAREGDRLAQPEDRTVEDVLEDTRDQHVVLVGNGGTTAQLVPLLLTLERRTGQLYEVLDCQRDGVRRLGGLVSDGYGVFSQHAGPEEARLEEKGFSRLEEAEAETERRTVADEGGIYSYYAAELTVRV